MSTMVKAMSLRKGDYLPRSNEYVERVLPAPYPGVPTGKVDVVLKHAVRGSFREPCWWKTTQVAVRRDNA